MERHTSLESPVTWKHSEGQRQSNSELQWSPLSAPCSAVFPAVPGPMKENLLNKMERPCFTAACLYTVQTHTHEQYTGDSTLTSSQIEKQGSSEAWRPSWHPPDWQTNVPVTCWTEFSPPTLSPAILSPLPSLSIHSSFPVFHYISLSLFHPASSSSFILFQPTFNCGLSSFHFFFISFPFHLSFLTHLSLIPTFLPLLPSPLLSPPPSFLIHPYSSYLPSTPLPHLPLPSPFPFLLLHPSPH